MSDAGHSKGDDLPVAGTNGRMGNGVRAEDARVSAADLYARHANSLFRFCLSQLRNRSEAEDAVQTTFLQAFRALQRGTLPRIERAWLIAIAQNVCRTMQRSSSRRRNVEADADPEEVAAASDGAPPMHDDIAGLGQALGRIPVNQRRALILREWQGLRYREIADVMGMSQTAVEMLAFRARRSLSEALNAEQKDTLRARLRQALDVGGILSALRALLAGGSAVHTVVGAGVAGLVLATFGATHAPLQGNNAPLSIHRSTAVAPTIPQRVAGRRNLRTRIQLTTTPPRFGREPSTAVGARGRASAPSLEVRPPNPPAASSPTPPQMQAIVAVDSPSAPLSVPAVPQPVPTPAPPVSATVELPTLAVSPSLPVTMPTVALATP